MKYLTKIPRDDSSRIMAALREISQNPFSKDVKKMHGSRDVWRRRVGAYRILYKTYADRNTVLAFKVARRSSHTYENL